MNIEPTENEQTFIDAYFEAVDFTETGDTGQAESGADLEDNFKRDSIIDCLAFYRRAECYLNSEFVKSDGLGHDIYAQAGHDFWLTRNGHGVGFWDRPEIYGETYAAMFTKWCEGFGEAYAEFDCTRVFFRVFGDGDIIALFPDLDAGSGFITSYQHIGQHSGASPELLTELEEPDIYGDAVEALAAELRGVGYSLLIGAEL